MFSSAAGVKLVHVPYRGAAPALQDLMGGQIDVVFTSLPSVAGSIKSAQLSPIAVTSAKRSPSFSTIPTIAEGGIRSFDVNPWFGLMAPGKTPPDVIARINRDINEQLRTKDVAETTELMALRHFLELSETAVPNGDTPLAQWLVVIDHHEARIYRSVAVLTCASVSILPIWKSKA